MTVEELLQHELLANFILPFLLIFLIVFGILEKTKLFGGGTPQLNAFIAFVIGLIFVGAASPKLVVNNLILFFTISIVVLFVAILLWGLVSGDAPKLEGNVLRITVGVLIFAAVIIALLFATGIETDIFNDLFRQAWSSDFWTGFAFIAVVVVALAVVINSSKS